MPSAKEGRLFEEGEQAAPEEARFCHEAPRPVEVSKSTREGLKVLTSLYGRPKQASWTCTANSPAVDALVQQTLSLREPPKPSWKAPQRPGVNHTPAASRAVAPPVEVVANGAVPPSQPVPAPPRPVPVRIAPTATALRPTCWVDAPAAPADPIFASDKVLDPQLWLEGSEMDTPRCVKRAVESAGAARSSPDHRTAAASPSPEREERLEDQERLKKSFQGNLKATKERQRIAMQRLRIQQEYRWLASDMLVERTCRTQEQHWRQREVLRREKSRRKRRDLASLSEDALNLRYGRMAMAPPPPPYVPPGGHRRYAPASEAQQAPAPQPAQARSPRRAATGAVPNTPEAAFGDYLRIYRDAISARKHFVAMPPSKVEEDGCDLEQEEAEQDVAPVTPSVGDLAPSEQRRLLLSGRLTPGYSVFHSATNPWNSRHVRNHALPPMEAMVASILHEVPAARSPDSLSSLSS